MPFFRKNTNKTSGLTVIGIDASGVCAIRVTPAVTNSADGGARLSLYDDHSCEDQDQRHSALATLRRQHGLDKAPCVNVMDTNYKLIMTDAPDVAPDELRAALRWRIKDLIDRPVEETTLDALLIPADGSGQRPRQIYVVAAENTWLQSRVDLIQEAGINLQVIDIAETALRNIAALLPEDVSGVATLWLREDTGLITLTRGGELYMSRTLSTGLLALRRASDPNRALETLALEIQRSLDYYESHFRLPTLRHLFLAPLAEDVPGLAQSLHDNIGVDAKPLVLEELIRTDTTLPEGWQARHLISIGAALRQEQAPS